MNRNEPLRRRAWKNEPLVLFVEGYSDLTFYAQLMEHVGHFDRCFIQDLGGKGRAKLREEATLLLKPDNLARIESVGILLDADENAAAAFSLASNALKDAVGVEIPRVGEWFAAGSAQTRYGVFIVGGEGGQIEVESLAWTAWSAKGANAKLATCVAEFVRCTEEADLKLKSIDKVRIGAALAVMNEDDPRLGPAARAGIFDFNAPEFATLREFLRAIKA